MASTTMNRMNEPLAVAMRAVMLRRAVWLFLALFSSAVAMVVTLGRVVVIGFSFS